MLGSGAAPAWCTQLRAALGMADADWHAGQHLMVVDTQRCSGALLLAHAMLMPVPVAVAVVVVVCTGEAPLHYQHVCRKLGGAPRAALIWVDLTTAVPASSDELFECIAAHCRDASVVIVDSLFPLQCAGLSALDIGDALRRVRMLVGAGGCLVTRVHGDAFAEQLAMFVYECDAVLAVREVSSADVTGRLALTRRGQLEARETLFTVLDATVNFRPL